MIRSKVTGMTFGHCEKAALEALAGVDKVTSVSHEHGKSTVDGAPNMAALIVAIDKEDCPAKAVS